ncbi:NAD-P-binding protein [Lentinula detonsa]|uniref:NAD-P-binding protein n=1 Tax=Lentinula detonsa TaxID=2804962 RepID=A0A9W8P1H7_9AGAR|nr:NAD-P-binding protein [Lentinula detonsa]
MVQQITFEHDLRTVEEFLEKRKLLAIANNQVCSHTAVTRNRQLRIRFKSRPKLYAADKTVNHFELKEAARKVAIVTGGNTRIGYATIEFLAQKGARVYMGSRNQGRAQKAIEEIEVKLQTSVSEGSCIEFITKEKRLDILAHRSTGLLDIMVVNHISQFMLTETLPPLLRHNATLEDSDVRIVNVRRHSKLANILHIKNLQTRLNVQSSPITCLAVHPGAVMTVGASGFLNSVPFFGWLLKLFLGPLFFSSWTQGAMTSAFALAVKEVAEARKSKEWRKGSMRVDEKIQRELYETTMEVLGEMGIVFQ